MRNSFFHTFRPVVTARPSCLNFSGITSERYKFWYKFSFLISISILSRKQLSDEMEIYSQADHQKSEQPVVTIHFNGGWPLFHCRKQKPHFSILSVIKVCLYMDSITCRSFAFCMNRYRYNYDSFPYACRNGKVPY